MSSDNFLNFTVVILVQLVVFILHACIVGEKQNILLYLKRGCILGLPFGIIFDLIIGKYIGIFDYQMGFETPFLILNGIGSYGLMMANVLLIRKHPALYVYLWTISLGVVYEVANYLFPVWEWTFATAPYEYFIVTLAGYAGLSLLMTCTLRIVYGIKFRYIDLLR